MSETLETVLRLNLGAGDNPENQLPGFVPVDRKSGGEIYPLRLADGKEVEPNSVDEIYASHVLEHLPARDAIAAVKEWARALKKGGRLRIAVPDLDKIVETINAGNPDGLPIQGYIFGGQTDPDDFHKSGYNESWLSHLMEQAGLSRIARWESAMKDCAALPISLNLEGFKDEKRPKKLPATPRKFPKTVAVMSLPRVAFTANMFCALQVATARGLAFEKVEGCWWHQCLERCMTPHADNDTAEWIWVLDYDSYFTVEHFDELCRLMLEHPEADAIAPMQVKRDESNLLMGLLDENEQPYPKGTEITTKHFEPELIRASWAHFGCTLFRVSALKKMKHPWFWEKPNADGRWEDNRTDADIGMWKSFAEAGNKLYLATHVALGHCQQLVTFPDQNLRPQHAYIPELQKGGPPDWVRR